MNKIVVINNEIILETNIRFHPFCKLKIIKAPVKIIVNTYINVALFLLIINNIINKIPPIMYNV